MISVKHSSERIPTTDCENIFTLQALLMSKGGTVEMAILVGKRKLPCLNLVVIDKQGRNIENVHVFV